jgi:hypothetical protein
LRGVSVAQGVQIRDHCLPRGKWYLIYISATIRSRNLAYLCKKWCLSIS